MIDVNPSDLAIRNAKVGETYVLLCSLKNDTELVLDCKVQCSQACSERWAVTPKSFRLKPRQTQSLELKMTMKQLPSTSSRRALASGGLKDVFYLKTQYFEQRFHCLVFGESKCKVKGKAVAAEDAQAGRSKRETAAWDARSHSAVDVEVGLHRLGSRITDLEAREQALQVLVSQLEKLVKDKDEVISMMQSHLQMSKRGDLGGDDPSVSAGVPTGEVGEVSGCQLKDEKAQEIATILGSNAQLRNKVNELSLLVEEKENELSITQEALKAISADEPKVHALVKAAVEKERAVHESRNRKVVEMFSVKDAQIVHLQDRLDEAEAINAEKSDLIAEFKSQLQSTEMKVMEVLGENQVLQKENYRLKTENITLSQLKPANANRSLEDQLVKTKEMNQRLNSKLREKEALEEFSSVKNQSLSESVHELEQSLASVIASNAEKIRSKDVEISLLTKRIDHSDALLNVQRNREGSQQGGGQGAAQQGHPWQGDGKASTTAEPSNLEMMLELKQEEVAQLKVKVKKLENLHEKAKQTAVESESKLKELHQRSKSVVSLQRSRNEVKELKAKLQALSRDSKLKLEQKEGLLKVERAKSKGLVQELVNEKERSAKATKAFSGDEERESMERQVEAATTSLKECQNSLQVVHAKFVNSEKEKRQIETSHKNEKEKITRSLLHAEQKVRMAELLQQQKINNLESTIRTLSGRSVEHKELAGARAEVVSLSRDLQALQAENGFLGKQMGVSEEKLRVAQVELQEHLAYGDLKEFKDVYGKYISESVVIVELSNRLQEMEREVMRAKKGGVPAGEAGTLENDALPQGALSRPRETLSRGTMTTAFEDSAEGAIAAESSVVSLQVKLNDLASYATKLTEQLLSKEKELAAIKDDLALVRSTRDSDLQDWEVPLPDQFIPVDKLEDVRRSNRDMETQLHQMEEKLSAMRAKGIEGEEHMKRENGRLSKKLEDSRNAEMETRRQLTEKSCSLDEKSVQLKILKEALSALKLGYVSNPCDEDHILLVAKVASADAKDIAHQRHVEYLISELDLRSQVIHETQGELHVLREDIERVRVEANARREENKVIAQRLKVATSELKQYHDENIVLESKLEFNKEKYAKLRMELDVEKQVVLNQRKRHFELIAAERRSIVEEMERFNVEHCNICESSRQVTRFIMDYDDAVSVLIAGARPGSEGIDMEKLQPCVSSLKYLGLEASKLFASSQTSLHVLSTETEILRSRVKDLELKNECLADKLALSDSMNVLLTQSHHSRSKIAYLVTSESGQRRQERISRLNSELDQAQIQVLKEHKSKCQSLIKGKLLEQKYLQLKCEVQSMKAQKEVDAPLPEALGADLSSLGGPDRGASDAGAIAQTLKFKLMESHLIQKVQVSNKQAEKARAELKELARSFKDLADKVSQHVSKQDATTDKVLESQISVQAELTLRNKENFELTQKLKHLSIEANLQKNETLLANRKVDMVESSFRDSLKVLDAALAEQRKEQQEVLGSIIEEARSEVSMTFHSILEMVKSSRETTKASKDLIMEDFKQIKGSAKDHSIQALANLSYLDINGIPVVKVSDLRDMKLQKKLLEQENDKLLSRLERKEKEVLELTEDVESQKLALRDLSNTFSKSAFKKMHSSGMLKSTISTLNKKLVESKLVQADMQRKLKISARAELELRQLLHSREQRLTTLNTEIRAYNQALDSIQKFAAKEKNLEFKRILRDVVLNLSTMKSTDHAISGVETGPRGDYKVDARVGVFSGMRIQIAEKNARVSHLEQKLSEYLASTPIKQEAQPDEGLDKNMLREVSKFNEVLKETISGAISKIVGKAGGSDQEQLSLDGAVEILLDRVKHAELMLGRSQAKVKALRGKVKGAKTEDANASLQNAVKGLSDKCRALVMEKADLKLERDRLLERLNALKSSASKKAAETSKRGASKPRRVLMKKPIRVLASEKVELKDSSSQPEDEPEGGIESQFEQVHSFADMIDVHLAAIHDFVVKSLNDDPVVPSEAANIDEDFSSIGSLVCVIKDTLKILASEVSDGQTGKLPAKLGSKVVGQEQPMKKGHKESEWESKYSSLKEAYSTYRKSSKIEMNALKEKNMNASAQVIEAAKDKVTMQAELRDMQRMVEKGILEVESRQKSRSNLALKLTEREAQLRIAKSKARMSEDQAQARIAELEKDLKATAGTITDEREERAKVLVILRKAVNDLKTQLHIEFDLRNQLYAMELEKETAVNSYENKENQLNSELKDRQATEIRVKELEDNLVMERQQSHNLKVKYEYMREGLKQLEIRFNAADKHRVILERTVQLKLNESEKIADSLSVVDFGKAPMMILLEVQEIEKLINKMSLEIQKAQKQKEVSSDKWKFTAQLARFKRVITDWKKGEEARMKKKISELKADLARAQNQNMDLAQCSEKAADTIVEMTRLRIQTKTEAMREQQHVVGALNASISETEQELEDMKGELKALKGIVKVDAKKIIAEFHEISEGSKREILGMMRSLERLIPGLKTKMKGAKLPEASRAPAEKRAVSGSDFTSEVIQEIQDLEGEEAKSNLELKLRLQCQLTKKTERRVVQLKSEIQVLTKELELQRRKYEGYPSREDLEQRQRAFDDCKKSLKDSKALCTIRLKEIKTLKEELVDLRSNSAKAKLKEVTERVENLQRRLKDSALSMQRKDVIINDLRQSVRDLQEQDLTEKWNKTEAKNKQLSLVVQRQSVAIRELRTNASQASKSLESVMVKEKSEKKSDLQKKFRSDIRRKDTIIAQMGKNLGQLEEELAASASTIEEASKREAFGRKAAEHDWIAFKTFMKNAISAVEKMSKIVVKSSNEMRGVVKTVAKAEKFQKMESSARNIAQLVEMSTAEVEDIMQAQDVQSKEENLETYLINLFGDMNKSIESIHRSNIAKSKEKFVASWDPSVLLSVAEILEKDFIHVRHLVSSSMKVLPEVIVDLPKRKAPGTARKKSKKGSAGKEPRSSTSSAAGTPGRSERDMLMEELEILAKRVKK
ncbi:hypothetical protein HOP50_03g22030 [Chloropicon primus]|nr:hypothetical protein HOP50_03g22030 [Chloropicon primus]